jgi:hypothetical protein
MSPIINDRAHNRQAELGATDSSNYCNILALLSLPAGLLYRTIRHNLTDLSLPAIFA